MFRYITKVDKRKTDENVCMKRFDNSNKHNHKKKKT